MPLARAFDDVCQFNADESTSASVGSGQTYFSFLSRSGQLPINVRSLINRYNIRIYEQETAAAAGEGDVTGLWMRNTPLQSPTSNYSCNNNDDNAAAGSVQTATPSKPGPSAESPATPPSTSTGGGKVLKLKVPSLPRRWSKFGKRASIDKNKSDGKTADTLTPPSSPSVTSTPSATDKPEVTPDKDGTAERQNTEELDNSCNEKAEVRICKSSVEEVPLRAKPPLHYHDAVFYYPSEQTADDDDQQRTVAHVVSEGRVQASAARSSDDRLPLKEVLSMQPVSGQDRPLASGSGAGSAVGRRPPSMLRRMRAFFGRSTGGEAAESGTRAANRQHSMLAAAVWTESADGGGGQTDLVAGGADETGGARVAHSDTSPSTRNFDSAADSTAKSPPGVDDPPGGSDGGPPKVPAAVDERRRSSPAIRPPAACELLQCPATAEGPAGGEQPSAGIPCCDSMEELKKVCEDVKLPPACAETMPDTAP